METEIKLEKRQNWKRRANLVKFLFNNNKNFNFLTERENEIMRMIHWDEMSIKDVSVKFGVNSSKISLELGKAEKRFSRIIFDSVNNYDEYFKSIYENHKEIRYLQSQNRILKEMILKDSDKREIDVRKKIEITELEVMKITIYDIDFSVRALNVIKGNFENVNTVADLFEVKDSELMKCRNCGIKSRNEIYQFFEKHGIDFKNKTLFKQYYQ